MFTHHPHPVALLAADGTVLLANLAFDQFLGAGVEAIGPQIAEFLGQAQAKRLSAALASASRLERVPELPLAISIHGSVPLEVVATLIAAEPSEEGVFIELRLAFGRLSGTTDSDKKGLAHPYVAMLDSMHAPVALLDGEGRITAVNAAWRHSGRENEDSVGIGKDYRALWRDGTDAGPESAALLTALDELLSGTRSSFEVESPWNGRAHRWMRVRASAVEAPFERGAVVMHVDVTKRHRTDERTQRAVQTIRHLSRAAVAAESEYRHLLGNALGPDALTGLRQTLGARARSSRCDRARCGRLRAISPHYAYNSSRAAQPRQPHLACKQQLEHVSRSCIYVVGRRGSLHSFRAVRHDHRGDAKWINGVDNAGDEPRRKCGLVRRRNGLPSPRNNPDGCSWGAH